MDEGIGDNDAPEYEFAVRMAAGVHKGALIPLDRVEMIVVGSADDCDVILADTGVASHHCILRRQGSHQFLLRAVDGPMIINGQPFEPGTTVEMHVGALVVIGTGSFDIVTPGYMAELEEAERQERERAVQAARASAAAQAARLGPLDSAAPPGIAAEIDAASEASLASIARAHRPSNSMFNRIAPVVATAEGIEEVFARQPHLAQVLRKSGLSIWLVAAALVAIVVAAALLTFELRGRTAQTAVAQPAMPAQVTPRSGDAIAHDVAEVLRLSGIAGDAHYSEDGTVTVSGHLGDSQQLASVIQSRAMHEIVGLKRVAVSNFDQGGSGHGNSLDGSRIVSVVASADPYVVTADGSRYYVGAALPQGGRLAGVKEGEVLVERDGRTEHWKLAMPTRESGDFRPTASLQ